MGKQEDSWLYQPEYTGENRCAPCTILNLVLAALFSLAIVRQSRIGGAIALGLSISLIYARGYLVPGTPELTKKYLPPEVLRWFGKDPHPPTNHGIGGEHGGTLAEENDSSKEPIADETAPSKELDPQKILLQENIIEPCEEQDDLCLTDEFQSKWYSRLDTLIEKDLQPEDIIPLYQFDVSEEDIEVTNHGSAWTLHVGSSIVGRWPSKQALIADIAAAEVLSEWSNLWGLLSSDQKGQLLNALRLFLGTCPGEDGSVSLNQETVESCCSSHEVVTVSCDETGDRLFEQPLG